MTYSDVYLITLFLSNDYFCIQLLFTVVNYTSFNLNVNASVKKISQWWNCKAVLWAGNFSNNWLNFMYFWIARRDPGKYQLMESTLLKYSLLLVSLEYNMSLQYEMEIIPRLVFVQKKIVPTLQHWIFQLSLQGFCTIDHANFRWMLFESHIGSIFECIHLNAIFRLTGRSTIQRCKNYWQYIFSQLDANYLKNVFGTLCVIFKISFKQICL